MTKCLRNLRLWIFPTYLSLQGSNLSARESYFPVFTNFHWIPFNFHQKIKTMIKFSTNLSIQSLNLDWIFPISMNLNLISSNFPDIHAFPFNFPSKNSLQSCQKSIVDSTIHHCTHFQLDKWINAMMLEINIQLSTSICINIYNNSKQHQSWAECYLMNFIKFYSQFFDIKINFPRFK